MLKWAWSLWQVKIVWLQVYEAYRLCCSALLPKPPEHSSISHRVAVKSVSLAMVTDSHTLCMLILLLLWRTVDTAFVDALLSTSIPIVDNINNSKQEPNNRSTCLVLSTNLWACFLTEVHVKTYSGHTYQHAPWSILFLRQEGHGWTTIPSRYM